MFPENIILEPIFTEKSNIEKEKNKYVFKVLKSVNKLQIKNAIIKLYNVVPLTCRIINVSGKIKRQGKFVGKTSSYKKAIVTLKKGEVIPIFEGA